jgi:hypothetical protein
VERHSCLALMSWLVWNPITRHPPW